jgi:hypothetical protein
VETTESLGRREYLILCWLLAFLLCIYLLGFTISVSLFVLLYLRMRSGEGWLISISASLIVAATLHILFSLILQRGLYEGFLWTILEQ